jgi:hypothetical protein
MTGCSAPSSDPTGRGGGRVEAEDRSRVGLRGGNGWVRELGKHDGERGDRAMLVYELLCGWAGVADPRQYQVLPSFIRGKRSV